MTITKYIGMDVHKESIWKTRDGMRHRDQRKHASAVHRRAAWRCAQTFEEGTWAVWLYDLLKPHVSEVLVCNPRKNALLKDGSKSDRIDARKLAELLRGNHLKPVYHGAGLAHIERTSTQLSEHQHGCHAGHESAQGVVS
jgi:hypothetical protein